MLKIRRPNDRDWTVDFEWKKAVVFLVIAIVGSGLFMLMILGLTKLASVWL